MFRRWYFSLVASSPSSQSGMWQYKSLYYMSTGLAIGKKLALRSWTKVFSSRLLFCQKEQIPQKLTAFLISSLGRLLLFLDIIACSVLMSTILLAPRLIHYLLMVKACCCIWIFKTQNQNCRWQANWSSQ